MKFTFLSFAKLYARCILSWAARCGASAFFEHLLSTPCLVGDLRSFRPHPFRSTLALLSERRAGSELC
jgi:hypothetical protein